MTTRPTDEEIREMGDELAVGIVGYSDYDRQTIAKAANMFRAWLAERQAARDGVTDEMVELVAEYLRQKGWTTGGDYVEDFLPDVRAVLQSIMLPSISKEARVDLLACDWQEGSLFSVQDEPGEHDACYLILPSGEMLAFVHHATNGVDQARAQFIADCCNQVLSPIQQPIAHPITSISDALNFLEEWALSGNKLHGDDIQQFHATVERIAPVAMAGVVPDELPNPDPTCINFELELAYMEGWNECREAMLAVAPEYKP